MIAGSVFLATYGGGHAAALGPVITRLQRDGIATCTLALTTARDALQNRGIDTIGIADTLALVPSFADAAATGARLAAGQGRHPSVSQAETEAYLGVGYLALERQHGSREAARIWAESGRQAFLPTAFFEELFARHRPAVVVSTNSPRSERAVLEAARNLGIASVCLVDLYAAFEIAWCGKPDYASTVCVLNEEVRARFIANGVAPARVVATGNPAFDRLGAVDYPAVRSHERQRMGLAATDRLILWISQPEPSHHPFSGAVGDPELPVRIDRHLATIVEGNADTWLICRLHPSEDRQPAVTGARIRYSDRREPLDALLCACDCVVTCSSTVGVEAALLGAPVIQLMDSVFSPDLPLQTMGMATAVDSYRKAAVAIDAMLCAADDRTRLDTHPQGSFDATGRVVREILALRA